MIGRKKIGNQIGQEYGPKKKRQEIVPGQGPAPGQELTPPGFQGGNQQWIDGLGGGFGGGYAFGNHWDPMTSENNWFNTGSEYNWGIGNDPITNMSDLAQWWQDVYDTGWQGWGINESDSFLDWWNNYAGAGAGTGNLHDAYSNTYIHGGTTGGSIGGQGDLGTGNIFIGGGMGSGSFGGGMSGQDCATLGPQFNSAGVCIACCDEAYAGAGFYGTGEEYEGGGSLDPDLDTDTACYDQYIAMQGVGGDLSYDEFAGLYC